MNRARTVAVVAMVVAGAGTWLAWRDDGGRVTTSSSSSLLDGAAVFRAKGCAVCHSGPETTASFDGFPSLVDAPDWAAERNPPLTADEYIRQSVLEPGVYISPEFTTANGPTDGMPQLKLSEEELDALVDHLLQRARAVESP